jgi:hypothetical protein
MIGGKKKALTSDTEPPNRFCQGAIIPFPESKSWPSAIDKEENVITEGIIDNPPVKSGRGGKLGLISGKAGAPKTAAHHSSRKASKDEQVDGTQIPEREKKSHSSPPPPSQPVKVPTPPPPETEEEKANRRREELKRQLDAKSKAPVKKKRKFGGVIYGGFSEETAYRRIKLVGFIPLGWCLSSNLMPWFKYT